MQPVDLVALPAAKEHVDAAAVVAAVPARPEAPTPAPAPGNRVLAVLPVLILLAVLALAVLLLRRRAPATVATRVEPMTDAQREAALLRLHQWLAADDRSASASPGVRDAG